MSFNDEQIQYILGAHWSKRIPVSIAASVRSKWSNNATTQDIKDCITKYSLRHHGKPVLRKNWPCKSPEMK